MITPIIECLSERYRQERKEIFPEPITKHLDDKMQTAFDLMSNSDLYKALFSEHSRLSEALSELLPSSGKVLFHEFVEVKEHMQYYSLDSAYLEGFKEGLNFIGCRLLGKE